MIQISHHKFKLDVNLIQTSPQGRPFRLSGTHKASQMYWIEKEQKHEWIYEFKYLDKKGGFVSFLFDINGKFKQKL